MRKFEPMMHRFSLGLCLLLSVLSIHAAGQAPTKITWRQLATTRFEEVFDASRNSWSQMAHFTPEVLAWQGQKVRITGYMVPVDVTGSVYALSAYTFSSCFFCGGAGPESVMGLELAVKNQKFKTDQVVTWEGVLQMKNKPGMGFHFTLRNASEWKE